MSDSSPLNGLWSMGAAAQLLTRPVTGGARSILGSRDAEADFLLSSWARQHALLAALDRVTDRSGSASLEVFAALAQDFRSLAPADLIERWFGASSAGLTGLFDKLGAERPRERHTYVRLVRMFGQDGVGAKTLRHAPHVTFRDVVRLTRLPDWMRTEDMRWMEPKLARQLASIGEALLARGDIASPHEFHRLVRSRNFASDPLAALARCGIVFTFPEPPWPGDDHLILVRDTTELADAAVRFRNCLRDRSQQCMAGTTFYYIWEGEIPAVVELQNQGGLCWSVTSIAGIRNCSLSEADQDEIAGAMPLAAINQSLWLDTLRGSVTS